MKQVLRVVLAGLITMSLGTVCQKTASAGLNVPPDSDGGKICKVTTLVDDETVLGSLRRNLNQGYNIQDSSLPSFCKGKIVFEVAGTITLKEPIALTNTAVNGFVLEKDAGVGEVILDASALPQGSCAIQVASNQVTLRGLTIKNASGSGVCIEGTSHQNVLDKITVSQSGMGVWVKTGSSGNVIQNGAFFDNTGFGVKLDDADQNTVTQNALYRNAFGAVYSPRTELSTEISTGLPNNSTSTSFAVTGKVGAPVDHVEIFRSSPHGNTNYILSLVPDPLLNFFATIDASAGEEVFGIAISADGSTGPSSTPFTLQSNPGGANGTTCSVTSLLDDTNVGGSIRLALNRGYKENDPTRSLCTQKIQFNKEGVITLHEPIVLDNLSRPQYTLEKGPDAHGDVVLDGSQLTAGSCLIVVDSNQITLRGISVQNANGNGVCIRPSRTGTMMDQMTVMRSINGAVVQAGARNTVIQNGAFFQNTGFGIKLEDAVTNRVSQNALYQNTLGPIDSPVTDVTPTITSLDSASAMGAQYDFTLSGTVPGAVEHVEIFRATLPSGTTTNYVGRVDTFNDLRFTTNVTAPDGEDLFLLSIKADGTTSAISTYHLDSHAVTGGTGGGNTTCSVTSLVDDATAINSLRRAVNFGYNNNNPATTLCSQKISLKTAGTIVLQSPIVLNNTSRANYIIEKDPTVSGEVVLDASLLPPGSCAITADANQITLRGITIQNPQGDGVCIAANRNGSTLDQITVRNSRNGAVVDTGAQGNTIQNGSFHNNTGFGVKLVSATTNRVTQNAIYQNATGPIDSPATDISPTITGIVSASVIMGTSQYEFTLTGTVPNPVEHIEVYHANLPLGATTNYAVSVNSFTSIGFVTDLTALDGEDIFLVAIKADGTTSAVGTYHLQANSASGADGLICSVTSPVDNATAPNSLRWALNQGYLNNNPATTLCSHKISFKAAQTIVLQSPIVLNNTSRANYILEKDPSVAGEVILDGSLLPSGSCAITADANQLILRGITVQNPNGDGVCIAPNRNGTLVDQVTVRNSRNGAVVSTGAQGNTIQNGSFHNNTGFGVKLQSAIQNRVTQNALYQNSQGPLDSPATDLTPNVTSEISATAIMGGSQYDYSLSGTVQSPLERIEIFHSILPAGATTNYAVNVTNFTPLGFTTNVTAQNGEDIFLVGIRADGSTSAISTFHLNALNASGQGGGDGTTCSVTSPLDDPGTIGSISWAMNVGYRNNNPASTLCSQKISFKGAGTIILHNPIVFDNASRSTYVLEKDPSVTGDIVLDGSQLPAGTCAITVDSNQVTLRGITVQNPNGDGICIASNRNGSLLDQVTVKNSRNGVIINAGAKGNAIQNSFFHDNNGVGVKLLDATFNRVTQNALYRNSAGPLESPAVQLAPTINSAEATGSPQNDGTLSFVIHGQVPSAVNHVELYRGVPPAGSNTNFVKSVNNFQNGAFFDTDVTVGNGEQIFAIAVANDGTTSSVAAPFTVTNYNTGGCGLAQNSGNASPWVFLMSLLFPAGILVWRRKSSASL
ncbi:MAG: right-handed parallel beta-helix repeat-containing protein [bacterium]